MVKTVRAELGDSGYDIMIGNGLLSRAGELAGKVISGRKGAIISDDTVMALYGDTLSESLEKSGFETVKFAFPHGENSKNLETYGKILEFLAENHIQRTDCLFALGGGVVGDMAGFAAATFLRGIDYIQIPTTLLAAVDSSVGGKTAVDLGPGKNLVGAFHQPKLVICDCGTLRTSGMDSRRDGWGEIIKYAMLAGGDLFDTAANGGGEECLPDIIETCVKIKRDIVTQDERDNGVRRLLNFGHTFGHGIERCSGYAVSHGQAVAMGMAILTAACEAEGICEKGTWGKLRLLLEKYSLAAVPEYSAEEISGYLLSDKKRAGDSITMVLPKKPGECAAEKLSLHRAEELLRRGLEELRT